MLMFGSMQTFTRAYTQSDFFGKCIMAALFALSLICWLVLCYKIWQAKKVRLSSDLFAKQLAKNKEHLLQVEVQETSLSPYIPHPFVQIFLILRQKTLEMLDKKHFFFQRQGNQNPDVYLTKEDIELLEQHVSTTLSYQHKILEKHLFILSTIVTVAPFLGLLGTVWGILVTFAELQNGSPAGSNTVILGGLSTALATTVLGLIIAIPALLSYNYLKNHLKTFSSDMEDFLYSLLSTIELQYRKVE